MCLFFVYFVYLLFISQSFSLQYYLIFASHFFFLSFFVFYYTVWIFSFYYGNLVAERCYMYEDIF